MSIIDPSSTSKALLKNTGIIAIGQLSTKIVSFFLLPVYTSLLTKEEYGLIDLLTTYSALITIFIGLQINQAIFKFLVTQRNDEDATKRTISTIFCTLIFIFAVYTVLFSSVQFFVTLKCKWFLFAHVIVSFSLSIASGVARGLGNNTVYAIGNFISTATILVLNIIVVVFWGFGIRAILLSYVIGPILGFIFIFFKCNIARYIIYSKSKKNTLKEVLSYSVPLIPNELSWVVIHSSDRWVITAFLGISSNGLIAVASRISNIYSTAFSIFNMSWTEQIVLHYKDEGGGQYINSMFNRMITFFASMAIGIIVCVPFVFNFLVNEQFRSSYKLVPLYIIAVFFNALIGLISAIYLVENETKQVAISTASAAAINLITDILLINIIGLFAAPVSSICGYAIISFWRLYDINKRHCRIGMSLKNFFGILCMLAIGLLSYYSERLLLECAGLVAVTCFALFLNYSFIISFIKQIHQHIQS